MEKASGNPGANPAGDTIGGDEFYDWTIEEETGVEAAVASLEVAVKEKRDIEQAARDRQGAIEREIARCEKVLKDTKPGEQGRHK